MASTDEVEGVLRQGMRLSKQSSYERRAPAKESLPLLQEAVSKLRILTSSEPYNAKAWDLLALAYECLLKYDSAIECLTKSVAIGGKSSKSQQKRLAMLQSYRKKWAESLLSSYQLRGLEEFLKDNHADELVDVRSLEFTRAWLEANVVEEADSVIGQFQEKGAFSDFQVYHNICRG